MQGSLLGQTMSSTEEEFEVEPDELPAQATLSKAIKELRNRIVAVKKSVTKGDKKAKKAAQEELEKLEGELGQKQDELKQLRNVSTAAELNADDDSTEMERVKIIREKKERKRQEKESALEANRQAALAEVANRPDLAGEEAAAFSEQLKAEGFFILEVAADGHCMFTAIGCLLQPTMDHWALRSLAADYLLQHRPEFEAFLDEGSSDNNGDSYSRYCEKVRSTGHWGGHLELEALSRALNCAIIIHQARQPAITFNDDAVKHDAQAHQLHLSYHRHAFSLGEHYNALLPIVEPITE